MTAFRMRARGHRIRNGLQSAFLLVAMGGLAGFMGFVVAGIAGAIAAFLIAGAGAMATALIAPATLLRMHGARPLAAWEAPSLYRTAAVLAERAGLDEVPALYLLPSRAPNAMTVGVRARPAIALTDGLLRSLEPREVAAVLAHEIGHVANRDLLVMAVADSFARFTSIAGQLGLIGLLISLLLGQPALLGASLLLVAAPTAAISLLSSLSQQREFHADLRAAELLGGASAMVAALRRIEPPRSLWARLLGLPGREADASGFRTHPDTAERVRRLIEVDPTAGMPGGFAWPQSASRRAVARSTTSMGAFSRHPVS